MKKAGEEKDGKLERIIFLPRARVVVIMKKSGINCNFLVVNDTKFIFI